MSDFFLLSQKFNAALKERLLQFCPHAQISKLTQGSRTSPLGKQADNLEDQLQVAIKLRKTQQGFHQAGLLEPETLNSEERKLIAYREAIKELQKTVPKLLESIDRDPAALFAESKLINGGSRGIFGQSPSANLAEVTASVNQVIKHSWKPLFLASQDLVNRIDTESRCPIHLRDSDTPFRFIAGKQRRSIADNLKGGLGTALEFIETLIPVISTKLLEQHSINEENFFEVAYNLAPLLNQFAMLHIAFVTNKEKLQNVLYKDDSLKLNLKEKRLHYDITTSDTMSDYVQTAFRDGFSEFKSEARTFNGNPTLPLTIGCPAHYVRIPIEDVPERILPPNFKAKGNSINLIDLLLFQYLHLLKHEIGGVPGRFDSIMQATLSPSQTPWQKFISKFSLHFD